MRRLILIILNNWHFVSEECKMVSNILSKMPSGEVLGMRDQKTGMNLHGLVVIVGVWGSLFSCSRHLGGARGMEYDDDDDCWRGVRQGTLDIHGPCMYSLEPYLRLFVFFYHTWCNFTIYNKFSFIKYFSCFPTSFIVSQVCKQCATISRFYCSTNSKYFALRKDRLFTGFACMCII